jgi:hypothetical protein
MKKIIAAIFGIFLIHGSSIAQISQNSTAFIYRPAIAEQNGRGTGTAITNGTATTQQTLDTSTFISSDAFASNLVIRARATHPLNITGGTYNFASLGTGYSPVIFASGGTVSSILASSNPGSGYAVGDVLQLNSGNRDAYVVVNTIGGGGTIPVAGDVTILYGGTGYTTGNTIITQNPAINSGNTFTLSGTLTSNATFILTTGTYIANSTQLFINNNTTGPYTVQFLESNGSDGSQGTGVYIPQGSNNSCATIIQKDGVNDIWAAAPSVCAVAPNYFTGTTGSIGGSALLAGACTSGTVAITGATAAMGIVVTPASYPGDGVWWEGYASSPGTVTVKVCAAIATTPSAENYNVRVLQ